MLCPHCSIPITVPNKEGIARCTLCQALLKIEITTLESPSAEWLASPRRNKRMAATTYCKVCQGQMTVGKEKEHQCNFYRPPIPKAL